MIGEEKEGRENYTGDEYKVQRNVGESSKYLLKSRYFSFFHPLNELFLFLHFFPK